MTRPTRRPSTLAGFNPVKDKPEAMPEPAPKVEQQDPAAAAPADIKPRAARSGRKKVAFEQHPDDSARMRGAVMATMMQEPHRSLTGFINRAIMAEVERLEDKYNGGKPFPPVEAGVMAPGRRMGSE